MRLGMLVGVFKALVILSVSFRALNEGKSSGPITLRMREEMLLQPEEFSKMS